MTEEDFVNLISDEDRETVKGVVLVLEALKGIDIDRVNRLLCQVRLAKPLFPKELLGSIESMETDFTLVMVFIEQAVKYDRSNRISGNEITKLAKYVTEKFTDEGTKTG